MDMSKTLYLIAIKIQFPLKLQMQDYKISYFSSLKLAPKGECMMQAFCLNKILPVCSLYLHFLFSTFITTLLNFIAQSRSQVLKMKRPRSSQINRDLIHCDTPRCVCKSSPVHLAYPYRVKLRIIIQHLVLKPLDMLGITRVDKTSLKVAKSFPTAKRVTVRLRVEIPTCG